MGKWKLFFKRWSSELGSAPEINDIAYGWDIEGKRGGEWYIFKACLECKKQRWVRKSKSSKTDLCGDCARRRKRQRKAYQRINDGRGYIRVYVPSDSPFYEMRDKAGYIMEHRLVMAQKLHRPLKSWEIVHHKGIRYKDIRNKSDNLEDNLELLTKEKHAQIECLVTRVKYLEALLTNAGIKFENGIAPPGIPDIHYVNCQFIKRNNECRRK